MRLVPGFRADIVTPEGHVIELQSKPLDAESVRDRERAYGTRLRWVVRVSSEQFDRFSWTKRLGNGADGFHWRRGPKLLTVPKMPVYLDIENGRLLKAQFKLMDMESDQWGAYERLMGWAWEATTDEIFDSRPVRPQRVQIRTPRWYVARCDAISRGVWRGQVTEAEATRDLEVFHAAAWRLPQPEGWA